MPHASPSDLELQVLSILWERGPSTVHAVRDGLPDGKARAYTTVLTVMQNMEKKGLVTHSQQGQANVYRPLVKKRQVLRPLMKDLLNNIFGGSPAEALQCLLDSTKVDDEELAQIREILADAAAKRGREGKK